MAEALAALKGQFLLSLNDRPEVRLTFAAFEIEAVETTYTVSRGASQPAGEVLITSGRRGS